MAALLGVVASGVAGCMPAGATVQGQDTSRLYDVFLVGGIVVAGIVWSLVTWSVLRYRRRDDRLPVQHMGDIRIEAIWTAIPLATVLALFVLTVLTLGSLDAVQPGGVNIRVVAFRWQWQVVYTDANVTNTGTTEKPLQIVLPVNTPVHVTLESLDVNHAMFLPAFLFKRDAIPGHVTTFDIQITAPGVYPGSCAEFCGVGHDAMLFSVKAVDMATYQAFLASQVGGASAAPGSAAPASAAPSGAAPTSSSSPGTSPAATATASAAPAASAAPSSTSAPGASLAPSASALP
ncbi:MAG: cytochrome c oxidase subunit II [Candidatus Limnocylindrales bacterium]